MRFSLLNILRTNACLILVVILSCSAKYADHRCKCECQASPEDNHDRPFQLIRVISSDKCKCNQMFGENWLDGADLNESFLQKQIEFCQNKCECVFETRNTFTIKFIVSLIILVLTLLCVYMIYLLFLDPYVSKRLNELWLRNIPMDSMGSRGNVDVNVSDPEIRNAGVGGSGSRAPIRQRQPILDGFHEWKEKVEEQRDTVYNRQAVLS